MIAEEYRQIRSEFGKLQMRDSDDVRGIDKVREALDPDLQAGEVVLFAGKGYRLLVTDRALYTDSATVPLEDIHIVTRSRFSLVRAATDQGTAKTDLLVNGLPVATAAMGLLPMKFLIRVLETLGRLKRRELGGDASADEVDAAIIGAAGVVARRELPEVESVLTGIGLTQSDALNMVGFMSERAGRSNRAKGLCMLVGGAILAVVPFAVAWLMVQWGVAFLVVLRGLALVGAVTALAGLWTMLTGRSHMDARDLAALWLEHRGIAPPTEPSPATEAVEPCAVR